MDEMYGLVFTPEGHPGWPYKWRGKKYLVKKNNNSKNTSDLREIFKKLDHVNFVATDTKGL